MAADGRGLQQNHINENFSKLAEALYIADRKARESVEARAQLEKKIAAKEKEAKESKLADLARKAREERAGFRSKESDGFDQLLGDAKKASSSKGKINKTKDPLVQNVASASRIMYWLKSFHFLPFCNLHFLIMVLNMSIKSK